jgi:hypothetical protein
MAARVNPHSSLRHFVVEINRPEFVPADHASVLIILRQTVKGNRMHMGCHV